MVGLEVYSSVVDARSTATCRLISAKRPSSRFSKSSSGHSIRGVPCVKVVRMLCRSGGRTRRQDRLSGCGAVPHGQCRSWCFLSISLLADASDASVEDQRGMPPHGNADVDHRPRHAPMVVGLCGFHRLAAGRVVVKAGLLAWGPDNQRPRLRHRILLQGGSPCRVVSEDGGGGGQRATTGQSRDGAALGVHVRPEHAVDQTVRRRPGRHRPAVGRSLHRVVLQQAGVIVSVTAPPVWFGGGRFHDDLASVALRSAVAGRAMPRQRAAQSTSLPRRRGWTVTQ